jgi:rod shape-determining protein MreD
MMQATYLGLMSMVLFFQLLPLETTPQRWSGPDLLLLISFAWALRRPDYLPSFLVAGIALMADLLLQRPPGLMAALMVVAVQLLKKRARQLRDQSFAIEWLSVAVALLVITLANRMILNITAVPQAPLSLSLVQLVMSMICYPVVVAISHALIGVRKVAPGEVDSWGQRL